MSIVSQLVTTPLNKRKNSSNTKNLPHQYQNITISPDSKKWNFKGLQSTNHHSKRKSVLGQTLQPMSFNPEMDQQDKKRSKSQFKLSDKFNITTITKEFDIELPKIKPNRKDPKRGPYLQNWLDEALSSDLKESQGAKPASKGTMKNVKGFQLDRIFLQSQNIPYEVVDRLYKSLFIYSHGIDKVFEQLIASLKINKISQGISNSPEQRLLNSFWKAFSRLLENCTSYQTAYQIVEKRHLGNIKDLKQKIIKIQENNRQQQLKHLSRISSLEKQLQQFMNKYGKLETEYKILESTYQLTDQTFNEQVSLRLKFEQKINAVYTSYNELKSKYQSLIDKLQITNHLTMQQKNKEDMLSKEIERLSVKIDGLQINLSNQQHRVKQLTKQLSMKSQQFQDLKMETVVREEKQTQGEDVMTEFIQKNKMLHTKIQAANQKHEADKRIIAEQKQFIETINQKLSNTREINDRLYQRVAQNQAVISNLQDQLNQQNHKLGVQEVQLSKLSITIAENESNIAQKTQSIQSNQTKIDILNKRIGDQESVIQKNNRIIDDLKAVKDKYQRINSLLLKQKRQIEEMYNDNLQKVIQLQEEKESLKMLITAKDNRIKELQSNILREKDICSAKVLAVQNSLNKREASILSYSKLSQQNGNIVQEKNYIIQKLQIQTTTLKNQALKKEIQFNQLKAKYAAAQTELQQTSKQYRILLQKYEIIVKKFDEISSDLSSKNYLLDMKKEQKDTQLNSLTKLLEQYKLKVIEKAQHVHPMLYEDLLFRTIRQQQNLKKAIKLKQLFEKQNQSFMSLKQQYLDKIKILEEVLASIKEQLQLQRLKNDRLTSAASRQRSQRKRLIENNKEKQLQEKLQQISKKMYQLQKQKADIHSKNQQQKTINSQLRKSGQRYRNQIEQLSRQINQIKSVKIQKKDREIQTNSELIVRQIQIVPKPQNLYKKLSDKEVQTEQIQQQKNQAGSANQTPDMQTMEPRKAERKIDTKQVRRALKFTYMRR